MLCPHTGPMCSGDVHTMMGCSEAGSELPKHVSIFQYSCQLVTKDLISLAIRLILSSEYTDPTIVNKHNYCFASSSWVQSPKLCFLHF